MKTLIDSGCVGALRKTQVGIKILSEGHELLKSPIKIEVSQISKKALEAVESVGGKVDLLYYNAIGLRALLKPGKFERMPYLPPPPPKLNDKLEMKMKQPEQFAQWRKQQELAKKLLEKLQTDAK
jgi:large subunit ribosomal protein L15